MPSNSSCPNCSWPARPEAGAAKLLLNGATLPDGAVLLCPPFTHLLFHLLLTIAFFSDVHGNLPALEAVLADMEQRGPNLIFWLGVLVGYVPWPNEVVNEVRRRGIPTLAGNYD